MNGIAACPAKEARRAAEPFTKRAVRAPGAGNVPRARSRRLRLGVEIAVVLLVKFAFLYAIWAAWFAHPASRSLDARGVAAALFHVNCGAQECARSANDPRP